MLKGFVACAVGLLLAAAPLAQSWAQTAPATTGAVKITNAWARATPGGAQTGAAYLTIETAAADRLTGVDTPIAAKAELHQMILEDGVMKMRPLAAIDLPAGKPVILKPGALHVMLSGLKAPLLPGQSFPLTLHFASAGAREVTVAVAKAGAMGPGTNMGQGMDMGGHHGMTMPMHH